MSADEENLTEVKIAENVKESFATEGSVVSKSYPTSFKEKITKTLHPRNVWKFFNHTYGPYGPIVLPGTWQEGLKNFFKFFFKNLFSGFTVSLVSLPLSISLGLAAQATPLMGIITACWSGLFSAALGGSDFNIMGPTGALSGNLSAFVVKHKDLHQGQQLLCVLAIVSGLMCMAVFIFRLDKYALFMPGAVIHGFTVGVAFIIALNQMNSAFGLDPHEKHPDFIYNVYESFKAMEHINWWATLIFAVTLAVLLILIRLIPKIPWTIFIAILGIVFGYLIDNKYIPISVKTIASKYGDLDANLFQPPQVSPSVFITDEVITASFAITLIQVLETLISAKIADQMTNTQFSQPREVFGLAIANIASGVCGGIPATAALARTALNIKSGATSKLSGIVSALSIFGISLLLLRFFKYLLLPVVAAILVVVAIRMVEYHHVWRLLKRDWKMALLFIFCTAVCIIVEPTAAIIIGLIIGLLLNATFSSYGHSEMLISNSQGSTGLMTSFQFDEEYYQMNEPKMIVKKADLENPDHIKIPMETSNGEALVYRIMGELNYLNANTHVERIKTAVQKANRKVIIINLKHLYYIDFDGKDAIKDMITAVEAKKMKAVITGADKVEASLGSHLWFQKFAQRGMLFKTTKEVLSKLESIEQLGKDPAEGDKEPVSANPAEDIQI